MSAVPDSPSSFPGNSPNPKAGPSGTGLQEVLPKAGLVYSEKGNLSEVLCKPKIMPIKSLTLEKIEDMEAQAARQPSIPATAMKQ